MILNLGGPMTTAIETAMAAAAQPLAPAAADRRLERLIAGSSWSQDALIELLHRVQPLYGYLPASALHRVAQELALPLSQVYGVASFYHLFHLSPPSAQRCGVCLGTACYVRGAAALVERLERRLGVGLDQPLGHHGWTLISLGCLGACGQGPLVCLNHRLVRFDPVGSPDALEARLDALGVPSSWPQAPAAP